MHTIKCTSELTIVNLGVIPNFLPISLRIGSTFNANKKVPTTLTAIVLSMPSFSVNILGAIPAFSTTASSLSSPATTRVAASPVLVEPKTPSVSTPRLLAALRLMTWPPALLTPLARRAVLKLGHT